jgi:predicted RNA-binding protein with PIN domain
MTAVVAGSSNATLGVTMDLLVDTWNVLHQTGVLPPESSGIGLEGLIRLLGASRWRGDRITLVCDGTPSPSGSGGPRVEVVFTGPSRSADDEIVARVRASSAAGRILVITSDREIQRTVRPAGASVMGSPEFLAALVRDGERSTQRAAPRPSGLSPDKAAKWRDEFQLDAETLRALEQEAEATAPQPPAAPDPPPSVEPSPPSAPPPDCLPPKLLEEARRLLRNRSDPV